MWCELHAFHHFCFKCSCSFALFLVISWFIQKIFFTPTSKPQSFTLGFQRASYLIWNGPMLRKTSIFLENKQRSTGFDEAPPKIYQRDFHKWYKIHDTLRISRFQNWWCSRSQKNPPKHQSQTPSIGGSNRWLMPLDAAPTPLQLARSWTSWMMEVLKKTEIKSWLRGRICRGDPTKLPCFFFFSGIGSVIICTDICNYAFFRNYIR